MERIVIHVERIIVCIVSYISVKYFSSSRTLKIVNTELVMLSAVPHILKFILN